MPSSDPTTPTGAAYQLTAVGSVLHYFLHILRIHPFDILHHQ